MSMIILVVVFVAVILVFWLRSIKYIKSIFVQTSTNDPNVEKQQILYGVRNLQLFIGFSILVITWQAYLRFFNISGLIMDFVTIFALLVLTLLSYLSYSNFKSAFELSAYVKQHQNVKVRYASRKRKKR